ncbi:YbjN domain-containing protein [Phaeovibrio sulfidiphilus]|uniref:YbjN domain-containing protein n=1 Tax=Phaeovibrio sulfidiphilus TaxID=1220600 RepID=A0A8J6YM15_9PROT|nr:YbjN domain-containing protein [Phaeovibrio sulfidiphilus]MBE1237093.1 YbjN domain-containing protein [Phaeovibrio sulfidiphilus]
MPLTSLSIEPSCSNPVDQVETFLSGKGWTIERRDDRSVYAQVPGYWCDCVLVFFWSENLDALQFSCAIDIRVPDSRRAVLYELLALLNERLWVGHFSLWNETSMPRFRHTLLLSGSRVCAGDLDEIVDIALAECERFYPAFQFALWGGNCARDALDSALLDTKGEA